MGSGDVEQDDAHHSQAPELPQTINPLIFPWSPSPQAVPCVPQQSRRGLESAGTCRLLHEGGELNPFWLQMAPLNLLYISSYKYPPCSLHAVFPACIFNCGGSCGAFELSGEIFLTGVC